MVIDELRGGLETAGAAGISRERVILDPGVGFAKRSGLVVDGTPDEFELLAGRLAVFRFEPT